MARRRHAALLLALAQQVATCGGGRTGDQALSSPLPAENRVGAPVPVGPRLPRLQLTHGLVKLRPGAAVPPLHGGGLLIAQNEYESLQVVVHAAADAAVSLTGLRIDHGSLPQLQVAVYRQHLQNITQVSNCEGGAGLWPDALIPDVDVYAKETRNAFPVTLPAGKGAVVLWVDLFVPPGTAPGNYSLSVTATVAEVQDVASPSLPLALEVLPFSLPSTPTLKTSFGALSSAAKGHNLPTTESSKLVPRYVEAMLMHRLTGDFLKTEQDQIVADFEGWSQAWGSFLSGHSTPFGLKG